MGVSLRTRCFISRCCRLGCAVSQSRMRDMKAKTAHHKKSPFRVTMRTDSFVVLWATTHDRHYHRGSGSAETHRHVGRRLEILCECVRAAADCYSAQNLVVERGQSRQRHLPRGGRLHLKRVLPSHCDRRPRLKLRTWTVLNAPTLSRHFGSRIDESIAALLT